MKTARGHRGDGAHNRRLILDWDREHPIGTKVKLLDGRVTKTWSHAGRDCYGAPVVFVACQQEPVEIQFLEIV
jgi:hypothetical protein